MEIVILTAFPKIFDSYFKESLFKRAALKGLFKLKIVNLRDYAEGKHQKIDDRPFGGGPGMVLMPGPIFRAIKTLPKKAGTKVILFSTRGEKLSAPLAKKLSKTKRLILICGRYEGVDERVADELADIEVSIGDYVLAGGELPAMITTEAVMRFVPGFLGKYESLEDIKGSYPVYTRPEEFRFGKKTLRVPKVLLSGNHKDIGEWRRT